MRYSAYARYYDRIGQSRLSLKLAPRAWFMARAELRRAPRKVLDLCCGTGEAALWFAARGCEVVGVDLSADMLRLAKDKGGHVTWLQQDMRSLNAGTGFDLVTCLYDSVNYLLTPDDLYAAFRGVWQALAPGGAFIFDYNTIYRYATRFDGRTVTAADGPDLFGVYRTDWDPQERLCTARVRFFARVDDGCWDRIAEEHHFRGWEHDDWAGALRDAGFAALFRGRMAPMRRVDDYRLGSIKPRTGRVIVLARKGI